MLGWFILGLLVGGAAILTVSYAVSFLSRYVMEEKLRDVKQRVKDENPSLGDSFTYIIKQSGSDIAVVHLLHADETIAEVSFNSASGIDSDLYEGLCNRI